MQLQMVCTQEGQDDSPTGEPGLPRTLATKTLWVRSQVKLQSLQVCSTVNSARVWLPGSSCSNDKIMMMMMRTKKITR